MKCPVCREPDLIMADRQGIEIDYCPKCRGIWLDRGELDKLIERSMVHASSGRFGGDQGESRGRPRHEVEHRSSDDYYDQGKDRRKRRGFLGELFDFD